MRAPLLAASLLFFAGCLNGDYNANDASVPTPPDMAMITFDLSGLDLYGAYNCTALNACERACTTKACVYMCRNMATPPAVQLEIALQGCFTMYCPTGAGQVCAPDAMGMLSPACMTCLSNTYIPEGQSCSPSQLPSECHMCVSQANACTNDP
jgi:hypothetical protein